MSALRDVISAGTVVEPDIWAARDVTLKPEDRLTPVSIAIWDAGVDTTLFPDQLWTPNGSSAAQVGNDHGISFDLDNKPTDGVLRPLTAKQAADYSEAVDGMEGINDIEAGIDSPAAEALRAWLAELPPEKGAEFLDRFDLAGEYSHGTHVAGIAAKGNPAARIAVIRHVFYDHGPAPTPSDEWVAAIEAKYEAISQWLKATASGSLT